MQFEYLEGDHFSFLVYFSELCVGFVIKHTEEEHGVIIVSSTSLWHTALVFHVRDLMSMVYYEKNVENLIADCWISYVDSSVIDKLNFFCLYIVILLIGHCMIGAIQSATYFLNGSDII